MTDTKDSDPIRSSLSSALDTAADALAEWLVEKARSRAKYRMYIEAGKPEIPDAPQPVAQEQKAAEAVMEMPTQVLSKPRRKPPTKQPNPNSKQQRAMALIRAGATDAQVYAGVPGLNPAHLSVCRSLVRRRG